MRRFIYLDTDTLNSYIAQIYDGLIQTQEYETQVTDSSEIQSGISPKIESGADFKILGKGIDGNIAIAYDRLKKIENADLIRDVQTKMLHDNAFDQLVRYLKENKMLNSSNNIGDFIEVIDDFYIFDIDYLKNIFEEKSFTTFLKNNEKTQIEKKLKEQQDEELKKEGANANNIKKFYEGLLKERIKNVGQSYDNMKEMLQLLYTIIPYRRTMCISNNMVVLNDKYMRDNIEMTSFKFGGTIKVLGYITNRIKNEGDEDKNIGAVSAIGNIVNQIMFSFFGENNELNIVHPIAIYYE